MLTSTRVEHVEHGLDNPARAGHPHSGYDFPPTRFGRVGIGQRSWPLRPGLDLSQPSGTPQPGFHAHFDMVGKTGWGSGVGGWTQHGLGVPHNAGQLADLRISVSLRALGLRERDR